MNTIAFFDKTGVKAEIVGDSIKLSGLSRLSAEQQDKIIKHAREHKSEIIAELKTSDLPNPDLPKTCPFNTGGYAPAGCRFSHDLLMNLIRTGVMPGPDCGCMFKHVCGERKS